MKDFLSIIWGGLKEPIDNNFAGWLLLFLMWILFVMLFAAILFILGWATNYLFLPLHEGIGTVTGHGFSPDHWEFVGKIYTHFPDRWYLYISLNSKSDCVRVAEPFYNSINNQDSLKIQYSIGRFYHCLYIKEIL